MVFVQPEENKGALTAAFQYLKGAYKKDGEGLFTMACSDRTRGNGSKLKDSRFRSDIRRWHHHPWQGDGPFQPKLFYDDSVMIITYPCT